MHFRDHFEKEMFEISMGFIIITIIQLQEILVKIQAKAK